jgi:hypothetical protein
MSLGLQRWGCSMQGGDFRGHLKESITDVNLSLGKSVFETSNALSEISK